MGRYAGALKPVKEDGRGAGIDNGDTLRGERTRYIKIVLGMPKISGSIQSRKKAELERDSTKFYTQLNNLT